MPQPYFVPVRPTCSRIAHSSGVSGWTSMSRVVPLMLRRAMRSLQGSRLTPVVGSRPSLSIARLLMAPRGVHHGHEMRVEHLRPSLRVVSELGIAASVDSYVNEGAGQ